MLLLLCDGGSGAKQRWAYGSRRTAGRQYGKIDSDKEAGETRLRKVAEGHKFIGRTLGEMSKLFLACSSQHHLKQPAVERSVLKSCLSLQVLANKVAVQSLISPGPKQAELAR